MSVLDTLSQEHTLMLQLVGRLERSLKHGEEAARQELRSILLILLPALERHEKIETLVFKGPAFRNGKGRALAGELGREHRQIEVLKGQMVEALRESWREPFPMVEAFVRRLAWLLRDHFAQEETRLWPACRSLVSRSLSHSLDAAAKRELARLRRDVEQRRAMISEYVGRDL